MYIFKQKYKIENQQLKINNIFKDSIQIFTIKLSKILSFLL